MAVQRMGGSAWALWWSDSRPGTPGGMSGEGAIRISIPLTPYVSTLQDAHRTVL